MQVHVHRAVLRIDPAAIAAGCIWVAEDMRGQVLGVVELERTDDPRVVTLESLFVEPASFRSGVGAVLLSHASAAARDAGAAVLRIESDPNAARFYERMGAVLTGQVPGATPGRMLPLYELGL